MENTIKNQINTIKETYNEFEVGQLYDHGIELLLPGHSLYIANEGKEWFYEITSNITDRCIVEDYNLSFDNLLEELTTYDI